MFLFNSHSFILLLFLNTPHIKIILCTNITDVSEFGSAVGSWGPTDYNPSRGNFSSVLPNLCSL